MLLEELLGIPNVHHLDELKQTLRCSLDRDGLHLGPPPFLPCLGVLPAIFVA